MESVRVRPLCRACRSLDEPGRRSARCPGTTAERVKRTIRVTGHLDLRDFLTGNGALRYSNFNNSIDARLLSRAAEGTGPVKPGNRPAPPLADDDPSWPP